MSAGNAREQRELFIWKSEHDRCLVRELLLVEPYLHKPQSKERGQAWKTIVTNLNNLERPKFRVAVRAVRDRFFKLMEKFNKNEKEEARASGIEGAEFDEIYMGLTDINQRMEEARNSWKETTEKEKEKENENKEKALDMRRKATESLSETRKRKGLEREESTPTRKRRSGDVIEVLQEGLQLKKEQSEMNLKFKEEELKERQLLRESQQELVWQQQQFMANMQAQQQQFLLQMNQQNIQVLKQIAEIFRDNKN